MWKIILGIIEVIIFGIGMILISEMIIGFEDNIISSIIEYIAGMINGIGLVISLGETIC